MAAGLVDQEPVERGCTLPRINDRLRVVFTYRAAHASTRQEYAMSLMFYTRTLA